MYTLVRSSSILALTFALTACTGTIRTQGELDLSHQQAEDALAQARSTANDDPTGPVRVKSGVYLAGATTPLDGAGKLPASLRNKKVVFVSSFSYSFREIADLILKETSIPVSFRGNSRTVAGAPAAAQASTGSVIATGPTVNGVSAAQRAQDAANAGASASSIPGDLPTGTMVLNYEGNFSGLLTLIASNYGLNWTYRDGIIEFATTQTATFNVPALAVLNKLAFTLEGGVQNAGGSGSGPQQTGGSSQKASTDMAIDVWKDLTTTLKNLVGSEGTIDVSGSTGTVTVNAPVGVVAQVKAYLTEQNKQLSRAIKMDITVYAVTLKQGDNYNLSVGAVNAGTEIATAIGSTGASASSTGAAILTKAAASTGNGIGAAIINPNSEWNGTNGVLQALSTRGDVSIVTSATLTTLNGIEAPFQVTNTRDYISQVSTTTTGGTNGSGTQTSLTPSTVTTGFTFYIVPRVDNNGIVQLQYGMNLSELVGANNGFDSFTTGGQSVQLKNVDSRNFVQQAAVPAGGTLILTGFEQKKSSQSDSGTGDFWFPLFGGGKTASTGRQIIIISITPKVTSFGTPRLIE